MLRTRSSSMVLRLILHINVLSSVASAFWRLPCYARLGVFRIDPIVSKGRPSQHAHTLHGGQSTCCVSVQDRCLTFSLDLGFSSSYDALLQSSCTTCAVLEDMSAYWTPPLMFSHANGSIEIVPQVGGMVVYYFLFGEKITAFPPGFAMVAGDANRRNVSVRTPNIPQSLWGPDDKTPEALAEKATGFTCLNYRGHSEGALTRHMLPNKTFIDANCANGLRLELMFPSCWNGVAPSAADYKSHVAYPDLVMEGACPEHYDARIPALFYETIWNIAVFKNVSGHFLLSNGDRTGSSYHGDFQNGWKVDILQQAIGSCTNSSGLIEDCSVFSLQSPDQAAQCILPPPAAIANESCLGPQPGLCGNVTL